MLSRILFALVLVLTVAGASALTLTGCDDDTGSPEGLDLAVGHDLKPATHD
jgi:hypothetical protein